MSSALVGSGVTGSGLAPVPVVEGWFTLDAEPALIGSRCQACGTYSFPPAFGSCPNPECGRSDIAAVQLSRTGTIWSCTDARYQPPPPYIAADPYKPFAIAAVSLAAEQIVVLGQLVAGVGAEDVSVGQAVELVVQPLYEIDGVTHMVWRWSPL